MSKTPQNLRYTEQHEWALVDGDVVVVGITDFAQDALGDITYLELPEPGASFAAGDTFGVVESVKTFSDLNAPVGGKVVAVNAEAVDGPESINGDPYGVWLIKIRVSDPGEVDDLLDASDYAALCEQAD